MTNWHNLSVTQVEKLLKSRKTGLTLKEARARLKTNGLNTITVEQEESVLKILFSQFTNLLMVILMVATTISFVLGENIDAIIILIIVFFSAILGFIQEYRSQKALTALKRMSTSTAHVLRNGSPQKIPSDQVVIGDILLLHWGDKIPADARVIEDLDLEVSEAVLTGESLSVTKTANLITNKQASLAERYNIVYAGTIITRGHGKAIVFATSMQTEFGKIAKMLTSVEEEQTPLEKKLDQLSHYLTYGSLIVCTAATGLGIWRGYPALEMFIWGVSLAVAAVPEALPAIVTGSLALGVWEMAKKKAIVRRLPAVETLGSVNVICSDKTGTLTRNEMTVREIFVNNQTVYVEGAGYEPTGKFLLGKGDYNFQSDKELHQLLKIGLLCNDALLIKKDGDYTINGDPTEGALAVVATKGNLIQTEWQKKLPEIAEIPFEMERKRMSTLHRDEHHYLLMTKGAPESILDCCSYIQQHERIKKLSQLEIKKILAQNDHMAKNALRVLGFAYRMVNKKEVNLKNKKLVAGKMETDLIFVGLAGMLDPPRDEAMEAIKNCRMAGIKVIIITGDHALTTFAIGKQIGLFDHQNEIINAEKLDHLSDKELLNLVDKKSYARISPEGKLRIVKALKQKGYVVAMTGDGVNDAPALKQADIGVAMGLNGTDVAKEASAMVLADDNFATIVVAIKKGREIYDNIKKYLFYLLHCNIGEILVLGGGFLFGLPPILSAIQILWINLATDGLPALALGVDPTVEDVMKRKPSPPNQGIFPAKTIVLMFILAINIAIVLLPQFAWFLPKVGLIKAQTMAFTTMVLIEMINSYVSRSQMSLFKINPFANKWLNLAVLTSLVTTFLIIQTPIITKLFGTVALNSLEWSICLVLSLSALLFSETGKFILNKTFH